MQISIGASFVPGHQVLQTEPVGVDRCLDDDDCLSLSTTAIAGENNDEGENIFSVCFSSYKF